MYWTANIVGGPRRVNHASVAIGEFIYSFGGYCSGEDYTKSSVPLDVHVLNTNNLRWSLIPPMTNDENELLEYPEVPFQRYGHTAVAYKECVFIWGGRNDEQVCDILFCFNTRTLKWSRPDVVGSKPGARDGHSASMIDSCMYLFGGFEDNIDQFSCDVHCLDLETMTWTYVQTFGDPPSYRDFHTATIINQKMYIFGGRGDVNSPFHSSEEIYDAKICVLDLRTNTWHIPTTTGKIPLGRRSHSAFIYKNMIYIFGGYNGKLNMHFNDLYCFDPMCNVWQGPLKTRGNAPRPRRRQSCLVIGTKMFLFGGTCPHTNTNQSQTISSLVDYNDTHVLDFMPTLKMLAMMCVIENNLDTTWLPQEIKWEIRIMTTPNHISRPISMMG